MVELLWSLLDGLHRTDLKTGSAGPTVSFKGGVDLEGEVGQNGDETKPGAKPFIDEEVIPTDPSEPRGPCDMFMGEMALLLFPVDDL